MKPENSIGAACRDCGKVPNRPIAFFLDPNTFIGVFCYDCWEAWILKALRSGRITEEQFTEIVMAMTAHLSEEKRRRLLLTLEAPKGDSN